MEIKDMSNEEFFRRYSTLKIEIDAKLLEKKQYEKEMIERLRDGRLGGRA